MTLWHRLLDVLGARPAQRPRASRDASRDAGDDRQAALDAVAKEAMDAAVASLAGRRPRIAEHFSYGATAIDGKHLTPWFLFRTDAELAAAQANGLAAEIERRVREELIARGWPADALPARTAHLTTREDIQRTTGGDYWKYFR